jgi:hypothetical protein
LQGEGQEFESPRLHHQLLSRPVPTDRREKPLHRTLFDQVNIG